MSWVELIEGSGDATVDLHGRGAVVRTFRVWNEPAEKIAHTPQLCLQSGTSGPGLPALGSTLPNPISFWLYRLESYALNEDQGTIVARAQYSNTRRYTHRPQADRSVHDYQFFSRENVKVDASIPVAEGQQVTIPTATATQTTTEWKFHEWGADYYAERLVFQKNVSSITPSGYTAIREQSGKVHLLTIAGSSGYYLFESSRTQDTGDGRVSLEYQWLGDPGIVPPIGRPPIVSPKTQIVFPDPLTNYEPPGSGVWNGKLYVRPPFHGLKGVVIDGNPRWVVGIMHPVELNGWQTLPGLT